MPSPKRGLFCSSSSSTSSISPREADRSEQTPSSMPGITTSTTTMPRTIRLSPSPFYDSSPDKTMFDNADSSSEHRVAQLLDIKEVNIEDPFLPLSFSLAARKKMFKKFNTIILDDDNVEALFDEEYNKGRRKSKEPLFEAYCLLREKAELNEEAALDDVLAKAVPRGLKRPSTMGTRYPEGPGRYKIGQHHYK